MFVKKDYRLIKNPTFERINSNQRTSKSTQKKHGKIMPKINHFISMLKGAKKQFVWKNL